jgi:nucleoid DNA-binding protein
LQNSQAKAAVEATLEEIAKQIAAGNEVRQTGETIQIAAKRVPKFSAGAELKKAVQ